MTVHVFKEVSIVPVTKIIDVRSIVDSSGPHMLCMGVRTVVAGPAAGGITIACYYEDISGNIQSLGVSGTSDLSTIDPLLGSTWYMKDSMVMDQYYPLGNSTVPLTPYPASIGAVANPYGTFVLALILTGSPDTSRFSYEARLVVDDGSPAVVYHP
jgi:hypothetical protein